ncbi:MAG: DUF2723 domain-containing protein, partial [Candidatus Hydrogenedentes bacterium]|nr:DUF2723 domain-containing protein [Candidatus Hydrogenedentota bacterium]
MRKTGSEAVDATSRSRFPRRDEDVASTFSPADYGIAGVCAAAALCVYLSTLAPTVTGEDSGELIAAAYTLGIPHPPGYPLWTMLAHLFTYLPWGTVAWRVNLVSAVFAAAAVGVLALLLVALLRGKQEKRGGVWIAAAGGALVFAFSREFWEQAVIAEVYTLNAFFFALFLLILWRWRETRGDRLLIIFAVLYGLSLGGHNTMHLLGPLFALFVVATERAGLRRWAFYGGLTLIAFLVALLVYAYLPL